jgi:predicted Zn-dependent peptidase
VLDGILGGSPSSRLFQEIREKRGLAYSVYTFASMYQETGEIGIYVGTRGEHVSTCLAIISAQIADIAQGGVAEAELRRAKENLKGRIMLALESTSNRATRLGKSLVTDTELLTPDEVIGRVNAVSAEEVAALAAELLAPERLAVAGIGPSARVVRKAAQCVNPALGKEKAA